MKNLIKEFNTKDALIVISSYPQKQGEPALLNAVACYTGNLLHAYRDRKIIVLCEITSEAEMYRRGNLLIARCYRRGSPLLYLDLIRALLRFNKPRQILLQFEFNMLGQTPVTTLLPIFLAAAGPLFVVCMTKILLSSRAYESHILPLSSIEPSSTRIISIFLWVCCTMLVRHDRIYFWQLYTGTIMLTMFSTVLSGILTVFILAHFCLQQDLFCLCCKGAYKVSCIYSTYAYTSYAFLSLAYKLFRTRTRFFRETIFL